MKQFVSSVSPKGQITLPAEIRRRLGVRPKDKVTIRDDGQEITIAPLASRLEAGYQSVPALKKPLTWGEVTAIAREEQAMEAANEGL